MSNLPIKGQESLFTLSGPNGYDESISHVKEASFSFLLDLIQEQYLGQVADQFDEIFRGVSVDITFDLSDARTYDLVMLVIDRAKRVKSASLKFSVCSSLKFPDGSRRRMLFPDLHFGEIPTNFGGRDKYAEVKFAMKGSQYRKMAL